MAGIAINAAESAASGVASTISQMLVTMAVQYFTQPRGTEESPVFDAQGRINEVLEHYRASLNLLEVNLAAILPKKDGDNAGRPLEPSTLLSKKYFVITNLRAEPTIQGPLHAFIKPIKAKLRQYHTARSGGWVKAVGGNPVNNWSSKEPIADHKLFLLLIIDRVLSIIGSYETKLPPDEGRKLVEMLRRFINLIIRNKLDLDSSEDNVRHMSLAKLLSNDREEGISADLESLDMVLAIDAESVKYARATEVAQQSLVDARDQMYAYVVDWLQTIAVTRINPSVLFGAATAGSPLNHYRFYSQLEEGAIAGGHGGTLKEFCLTNSENKEAMFFLLKILHPPTPISLDPTKSKLDIKDRILLAMHHACGGFIHDPVFEGAFESYCVREISAIFQDIPRYNTLLAQVDRAVRGPGAVEKLYTPREANTLAEFLLHVICIYHYFGILNQLLREMQQLGRNVGNLAGVLLPQVIGAVIGFLKTASVKLKEVEMRIDKHKASSAYAVPILADLRSRHTYVSEKLPPINRTLQTAISLLNSVISVEYCEALKGTIRMQIHNIAFIVNSIDPVVGRSLESEFFTFGRKMDALFSDHGAGAASTAVPMSAPLSFAADTSPLELSQQTFNVLARQIFERAIDNYSSQGVSQEKIGGRIEIERATTTLLGLTST